MRSASQRTRLVILGVYILILFGASNLALGSWFPPTSEKGLWFYSGLAAILLGNLLVTPFFTKPADAISYSVAALVALLAVNVWSSQDRTGFDRFLWSAATFYIVLVLFSSIVSIVLKNSANELHQRFSRTLYLFSETAGTPKALFSAVFLYALVVFHRENPSEYLWIGLAWAVLIGLQPLEILSDLIIRWWEVWRIPAPAELFGEVVGHETPGVVLVRHQQDAQITLGDLLVVRADDGRLGLALALDHVGFADGLWLRAIHLTLSPEARNRLEAMKPIQELSQVVARVTDVEALDIPHITDWVWERRAQLVGIVAPETDISQMRIEVVRTDLDLEEGRLVEVMIGSKPVLYQIVNGLTREEILQQKNTRGYVRAEAKKIGRWSQELGRFEIVGWVPRPNAPVFLVNAASSTMTRGRIGHFPGTDYDVSITDLNALVTHNTAILGILGAGKSYLALELVERMIAERIKVICLDLTNQYALQLAPYYQTESEQAAVEELQTIGRSGKGLSKPNVEEGGSVVPFKTKVSELLKAFLNPATQEYLRIYNPTQFEVWRQDSRQFQGNAAMASLTPTEITRIFTEAALQVLQEQGMSEQAKCCLVFEEAHSLIPEWNAVASEGDKAATNGTAKAILQGRKYGLGCMVITQRTANVTKSILNQCNTVCALRVFDATGVEFLKNYIGEDYAGVLSTLEDRHAVVFGRASSCRNPVLVRLNDREDFLRVFRETPESSRTEGAAT